MYKNNKWSAKVGYIPDHWVKEIWETKVYPKLGQLTERCKKQNRRNTKQTKENKKNYEVKMSKKFMPN